MVPQHLCRLILCMSTTAAINAFPQIKCHLDFPGIPHTLEIHPELLVVATLGFYLYIRYFHASALFSHKYIIDVNKDIAIKCETEAFASQVGNGIHENEFVQPKIEVIAEENPLDPIMQTQVLHHCGMQCFVSGQVRNGLRGFCAGQQHWLIRAVV